MHHAMIWPGAASRARFAAALLAVLLGLSVAAPGSAQTAALDLSSPRATFRTFLDAMVDVKGGETERIADATACLDLDSAALVVRGEGAKIARDLKTYLDKVERIQLDRLPDSIDGSAWVWRRSGLGEISMSRTEDGAWLFSGETIDSLPRLLESVRDRPFVTGLTGGGGRSESLADWIRGKVPDSLQGRGFILELWQWLGLALLAFLGVALDQGVRLMVDAWLRRLLERSASLRDKDLLADFERPIGILAMAVFWRVALPALDLSITALGALRFATQLMMAGAGVWAAYRLVDLLAAHFAALASRTESKVDDILVPLVRRALKIVVMAFGVLFVAQNLDIDITSLLAGLGIGGLAFALAAKDTVENLFGSVTVLVDRPFQIGDWVQIGDQEGTVEEIGFRSTRLRTFYNSRITIPNSKLVNTAVDNLGARRYRRLKCMLSIQYDTPAESIEAFCEGVRELIRRHPYTRKDYYMVYFNQFAESSLNVLLYAFHEAPDWATELRERHRLFVDIVRLARRLGVEFAFPTQTLHVASTPSGSVSIDEARAAAEAVAQRDSPGASAEDPVGIGRTEAQALVRGLERQPPVDFTDPERIRPD